MIFGLVVFILGYVIFYWGLHHMPWYASIGQRYPLACLLGFGSVIPGLSLRGFQPIQFSANLANANTTMGGSQGSQPTQTQLAAAKLGSGVTQPAPNLKIGRTDQGVDFGGAGPLYAVNSGTIVNVYNSGWPGGVFIVLRLDNPAGLPSPDVYYAEDIAPNVSVGQHVNAGQIIGTATGGSSGVELGWADPSRIGQALAAGTYKEGVPTSLGQSFRNWITGGGGTPA